MRFVDTLLFAFAYLVPSNVCGHPPLEYPGRTVKRMDALELPNVKSLYETRGPGYRHGRGFDYFPVQGFLDIVMVRLFEGYKIIGRMDRWGLLAHIYNEHGCPITLKYGATPDNAEPHIHDPEKMHRVDNYNYGMHQKLPGNTEYIFPLYEGRPPAPYRILHVDHLRTLNIIKTEFIQVPQPQQSTSES